MHPDAPTDHTSDISSAEPRSSRRRLLRLAGAATVGAAGASVLAGRAVAETGYTTGGATTVADTVSQVQSAGRPGKSAFVFATIGLPAGNNNSSFPSALAGWSRSIDNPHGVYGFTDQQEGFGVIGVNSHRKY